MKPLAFNISDDDPDRIVKDGERIHVPMMFRDGVNPSLSPLQRQVAENSLAQQRLVTDGHGRPAGFRPGFLVLDNSTDVAALKDARTTRDAEYQRYEDSITSAWRGSDAAGNVTNEAVNASEGASCTVRNSSYPNDTGKPGTLQRIDGALVCVPSNPTNADATTDPRIVAYDFYDRDLTTAWKGNR